MTVRSTRLTNLLILLVYISAAGLSAAPQLLPFVFALLAAAFAVLGAQNKLYMLAPVFLFFSSSILYFSGVAIADLYYAAYIVAHLLWRPRILTKSVPVMAVIFMLYSVFVMTGFSLTVGIEVFLAFLFLVFLMDDMACRERWGPFCSWYIIAMVSGIAYGACLALRGGIAGTVRAQGARFTMAFTDPNYAGMFLSIGLYMLVFRCGRFKGVVRLLLIAAAAAALLMTVSSTAILCNIIVIAVLSIDYLPKARKDARRFIKYLLLAGLAAAALYYIGSKDIPYLSRTLHRFMEKIFSLRAGDLRAATTERSSIWRRHLRYFADEQGVWRMLFGGNYLTDRGLDATKFHTVSHEVYIDSLICFGLVGTLVYAISILRQISGKWRRRNRSREDKLLFVMALIWVIYSFGLSMFPFWAFSFALFAYINPMKKGPGSVEDSELRAQYPGRAHGTNIGHSAAIRLKESIHRDDE